MQSENESPRALESPGIVVIDVPEGTSAGDASRLLNAPGEEYMLVQILPVHGSHRAYLRRYKQVPVVAKPREKAADAVALSIVRANREKPIRTIVALLAAAGAGRGRQWVCDQLTATCAEDGREEEALAYVSEFCKGSSYTPKDVVDELRHRKIRRSSAWARQKLDAVRETKS